MQSRVIGTVRVTRDLTLKELHDPGLRRLGLRDEHLTQTPPTCYPMTRSYGQALFDDHPDVDGFVWMSGRFNTARSFMLIDNHEPKHVSMAHTSFAAPSERDDLIRVCEQAGIAVTLPTSNL